MAASGQPTHARPYLVLSDIRGNQAASSRIIAGVRFWDGAGIYARRAKPGILSGPTRNRSGATVVIRDMRWRFLLVFLLAFAAWAANIKLYLKDGNYHMVREYQVESDRVRFYSVERSEWEEMPLNLVDLKRTEAEAAARKAELEKDAKIISEEDKAERAIQEEVMKIPQDPGVYWVEGGQTKILKQAESNVRTNKGRSILKRLAPLPVVSGKATLELDNPHSLHIFTNPEQEFYFQLSETERFAIVKLTPKGNVRIVENITTVPVTNEVVEEPVLMPILHRQLADNLYKIWPKEPLAPGEYAVVEYTDGKMNMQLWDFAVKKP